MPPPRVNWYENNVRVVVDDATGDVLNQLAFQVLGQAQVNITQNGQVDTGFLRNSGYVVSEKSNTFGDTDPSGEYQSRKTGDSVQRNRVDQARTPDDNGVVAGFAADYAIYQEMANSFLFTALEQVAAQAGAGVEVTPK